MTPEQKQSELQRYNAIVLATLDYLEERFGGSIVYDQYDPVTEYYQKQKLQTEKYFRQHKLYWLQKQFTRLTKGLQDRVDMNFAPYIKEKTGYEIDIFEDLRKRVEVIITQKEIRSQKELYDIGKMLSFYQETKANEEKVEKLRVLLIDSSARINEIPNKRKGEYSEVVSSVEKDGIKEVTIVFSSGPKPKHFEEEEVISPDGKRRLRVTQWGDGKNASTYVAVEFPTANGAVYAVSDICTDIKAWWKDNSTIVIETKKEYTAITQNKQVRSFDDVIRIEYIEH